MLRCRMAWSSSRWNWSRTSSIIFSRRSSGICISVSVVFDVNVSATRNVALVEGRNLRARGGVAQNVHQQVHLGVVLVVCADVHRAALHVERVRHVPAVFGAPDGELLAEEQKVQRCQV